MNKPLSPDEFFAKFGESESTDGDGSARPHTNATPLWTDDADWIEADIPRRQWLAKGYLLRGALTVVSGPGGVSKSALMVSYCVALALGTDLHGFRPEAPCKVMVYNVEDDRDEQRRRFSAALRRVNGKPADLAGKVMRLGPHNVGTLIGNDPEKGLVLTPAMDALERHIRGFRPDALILDPLVELHAVDENDNTALRSIMARFRSMAIEHDLAIVILHHTRKGAVTAGDPDGVRGASSIIGAARIVLTVTGMSEEDAKAFGLSPDARRNYFRVDGAKSNYAALTSAEWFERLTVLLDNGDAVASPEPWTPPVDVVTLDTRTAIEAAIAAGSPAGPWSPKLSTDARSVKHLFARHGIATLPGQKQFLAELLKAGFVVAAFRRPDNRVRAQGLRTPSGQPASALWFDETDDDLAATSDG